MVTRKHINRRDFLRGAAGVAAVAGLPSVVPSSVFGAGAPSERITIGFIACGIKRVEAQDAVGPRAVREYGGDLSFYAQGIAGSCTDTSP